MSDREFDNYLTLLSGLLRLSSKQRQAIADELRSHLEDRFDELMSRGVSKEDAVRQALAELGDAAGLAGQFLTISHSRKRRWLMRLTTFSVAATLLLAAGIAIFWPGRNAAPGVASAVAQTARAAGGQVSTEAADESEPTLQEKLNKRINANFDEVPLKHVIRKLRDETQIQFVVVRKKLEEAGVNDDVPVSVDLTRVRVRTVLELILKDLELSFVERDDLVLITTPEDAESDMEIRVYDCRDLLAMASPDGRVPTGSPPAASSQSTLVRPDLTPPFSAAASKPGYFGAVIDDAAEQGRGVRVNGIRPGGPAEAGALKVGDLITMVGDKPIKSLDDFDAALAGASVGAVLDIQVLREDQTLGRRVTLGSRPQASEPMGTFPTLNASTNQQSQPALNTILPQRRGGTTSMESAPARGRQEASHTEFDKRTDQLIELITSIVKPDSWDDVGGPGAIDAYNGLIVIAQTDEVHKKVEHVFDMLREAAGLEVPKTGKVVR